MARLNDLPTTLDSVESLKRRFIRQNREIARANSVQSIRIRTLEAEVSHLLAENITLREGIISANNELEQYRSGTHFEKRINSLRERFESGLGELSALVKNLNKLPSQFCENSAPALKGDPPEKEEETKRITPRNRLRLSEDNALLDDGSYMPAIPEDRAYAPEVNEEAEEEEERPQRDDVVEEFRPIDNVEVPETGSEVDARTRDQEEPHLPCATNENSVADVLRKVRPINTRPKRRDSSLVQTLISKKDVDTDSDVAVLTVAGSKRKLEAQDFENLPQAKQQKDEFQYTLTKKAPNKLPDDIGTGAENEPGVMSVSKEGIRSCTGPAKSRKALEPKNVNLNPKSTMKKVAHDNLASEKRKASGRRKTEGGRNPRRRASDLLTNAKTEVIVSEDAPPLNKPIEITLDDQSQDTVPSEIFIDSTDGHDNHLYSEFQSTSTIEGQAQRSRPSRRSRGPVNYAEPSLRGKMRRPTEDLVDAVADHTIKRLSRSYNDHIDAIETGLPAKSSIAKNVTKMDDRDGCEDKDLEEVIEESSYSSENDTDTDGTWSNRGQRARSMRAPTPDPTTRPVRHSRRNSSHPNYRLETNPMAHIPA
ncbi:shugoshin C terminal domain-containing protein [Nannizzia gypsea CBS 118893]|uniref:Shugoshin C terminal domain-containing protein n=1 Tax=Arthroderma gypseum (strain ATCC MYA-4604 / CBS 118893) TaxID=535722 RepID=E5QZ28_ARTGP|nr:shugoshin C terminal domain-containing protein [Nannizzia gypsea CBS 118893]EFQ98937.1 shugoshin C terminal domain-containing protein [Nannizzia gypsea CBS 118893]